jgi:hypothetical protein
VLEGSSGRFQLPDPVPIGRVEIPDQEGHQVAFTSLGPARHWSLMTTLVPSDYTADKVRKPKM